MWAFCWHTAYKTYKGAGKCMFSKINSYNILICILYWMIAWLIDTGLLQLYVVIFLQYENLGKRPNLEMMTKQSLASGEVQTRAV